jgi:hypothetical protein
MSPDQFAAGPAAGVAAQASHICGGLFNRRCF